VIKFNVAALQYSSNAGKFLSRAKKICAENRLALVLMADDLKVIEEALKNIASARPLVYVKDKNILDEAIDLCAKHKVSLATQGDTLDALVAFTQSANKKGLADLVLEPRDDTIRNRLSELTQIRRLALKKKFRPLGYPALTIIDTGDPYEDVLEAATCIAKYSGIVLLKDVQKWQALALLTLRQSIYTDPQKPLQVEPKLYSIGATTKDSPVAVTTNFSLTYYTVLSELEASKLPIYLLSVDTEGMSVLTAWAAEKFNADVITQALNKCSVADSAPHKNIIIPGYVAVMSGDLEDKSGWKVAVGPREAAAIPQFLKNFKVS
jgi:acetyl-CoA decarbonylase/synthase complex subunit gamma